MLNRGCHRTQPQDVERVGDQQQHPGQPQVLDHQAGRERRGGDQPRDCRQARVPGAVGVAEPVGEPAAGEHARRPADQEDRGEELPARDDVEVEAALEHRRGPQGEAVAGQRAARGGRRHQPEARLAGDHREGRQQARRRCRRAAFAGLVADDEKHDGRERDAGDAHDNECRPPVDPRGQVGADQSPGGEAERDSEREDGQRPGALVRREIVGDQRIRRRDAARLADTDAKPEQEQLEEAGRGAAQRGEAAPHDQRPGDDAAAAGAVGDHRQRHREHRVEDREREAGNRPELRVRELQIGDDRSGENAEDLPVEEVEDVGEQQQREDEVGAAPGAGPGAHQVNASSKSASRPMSFAS